MNVTPAHCSILSSTTTLGEGLRVMEGSDSSYLLLRNEDEVLSGIFTKSDLLDIIFQFEKDSEIMSRPMHQFMKKPVKTLPVEKINSAARFLTEQQIDHLPITHINSETGFEEIAGIITSRAIFDSAVATGGLLPLIFGEQASKKRKVLGVMGVDGSLYNLFKKVLSDSTTVDVERYRFANFQFEKIAEEVDALIMDIDDIAERIWLPLVIEALKRPELETVFLTYTMKDGMSKSEKLTKIVSSGAFRVFHKPVDISGIFKSLEDEWLKS